MSGRSIITCTVKDDAGRPVVSQTVSVEKAAAVDRAVYNLGVQKDKRERPRSSYPYAQPKNSWYVRCAAAGNVSATKLIVGSASATARRKR